jgi:hypothetical protein
MEQEETRAIRTDEWLYMKRFQGSRLYPFEDALYNLVDDPDERNNLIASPHRVEIAKDLSTRIDAFFNRYADPKFDLWHGGSAKSNSDKPWLWQDAWGEAWETTY